jgi:hypothetical protein
VAPLAAALGFFALRSSAFAHLRRGIPAMTGK